MTLNDTLAPIAARLVELANARATIEAEEKVLKAQIRDLVPGPDTYTAGTATITVAANRRLALDKVAADYPAAEHPYLYDLTPDTKKVRAKLSPADVDRYMVPVGEDRITVKDAP